MTNAEKRQENNQVDATTRMVAQTNRRIIESGLRRKLSTIDNIDKYIDAMWLAAVEDRNVSAQIEINNRLDGKVKDEIKVDMSIRDHIPNQEECKQIADSKRLIPAPDEG